MKKLLYYQNDFLGEFDLSPEEVKSSSVIAASRNNDLIFKLLKSINMSYHKFEHPNCFHLQDDSNFKLYDVHISAYSWINGLWCQKKYSGKMPKKNIVEMWHHFKNSVPWIFFVDDKIMDIDSIKELE